MSIKNSTPKLHFRRLEFKYVVPTKILDLVIPTISRYLNLDSYASKDGFYEVNSLYFDSPNLICYQQKLDGILFRKKYRIRYYGDKKNYFFEIKRKHGDIILKDRVLLPSNIKFHNQFSINNHLLKHFPENNLKGELLNDYYQLNLKPKVFITYKRRPFVSKYSSNLRITLDYDLKATRVTSSNFIKESIAGYISSDLAVLEIKFNESLPAWVRHIITTHNLRRDSFSKYTSAIEKLYHT